ncbi:MAG: GNAT family N-acetyltransferase [Bacteroidia bacterium]
MTSLRTAIQSDLKGLKDLFLKSIQQACKNDYSPAEIAVWTATAHNQERWQTMLETQYVLVAEIDGRLAGFGTLKGSDYLDFMYVHPDFLRRGVAGKLLQALEEKAHMRGSTILVSDISITARPFFEKSGFVVLRKNHNERDGEVLVNFRMEKKLSDKPRKG